MFFMMYKVKGENIDYFTLQGSYDGYTFYSVGHDKTHLTDIVEAYSEMSNEIHKQTEKSFITFAFLIQIFLSSVLTNLI